MYRSLACVALTALALTAGSVAGVSAQITAVDAKAFAKIYAMLKPNQQSRASQAFELMSSMFSQGGGRGPGGGGMGRRNGGER